MIQPFQHSPDLFPTVKAYQTRQVVSAEDGRLLPWDEVNGHWLLAGQGLLIKFE